MCPILKDTAHLTNGESQTIKKWEKEDRAAHYHCWELTTLWVARLDYGMELKVTDPKEQQGDIEEEETEGKKRWDRVDCRRRGAGC